MLQVGHDQLSIIQRIWSLDKEKFVPVSIFLSYPFSSKFVSHRLTQRKRSPRFHSLPRSSDSLLQGATARSKRKLSRPKAHYKHYITVLYSTSGTPGANLGTCTYAYSIQIQARPGRWGSNFYLRLQSLLAVASLLKACSPSAQCFLYLHAPIHPRSLAALCTEVRYCTSIRTVQSGASASTYLQVPPDT